MLNRVKKPHLLLLYTLSVIVVSLMPGDGVPIGYMDKIGHFLAYAGLAILALLTFDDKTVRLRVLFLAVLLGGILEVAQFYVPGRHMSLIDGVANTLGIIVGALVFRVYKAHQ